MHAPIEALPGIGERTLSVFKKAGLFTVGDLSGGNGCAQSLRTALNELERQDSTLGVAHWRAMAARVLTIVYRVRSDDARPYEPDHFICPITLRFMEDPVVSKYGHSYERHAIEELIKARGHDAHRQPLSLADLVENRSLRDAIHHYRMHELRFAMSRKELARA